VNVARLRALSGWRVAWTRTCSGDTESRPNARPVESTLQAFEVTSCFGCYAKTAAV
jgi:hypothetical protein